MRHLPSILLLCAPAVLATPLVPWQSEAIQERQASIHAIRTICKEVDELLLHLNVNDTPDTAALENSSMPQGAPGETIAEADGGMLFDAAHSRITYINNVRVNDQRARLRCTRRLYVQLPQSTLNDRQDGAQQAMTHSTPAPASQPADNTAAAADIAPLPGLIPQADTPATLVAPIEQPPVDISADEAVIDTKRNCILLIGSTQQSPAIHLRRGHDELTIHPTGQSTAPVMFADANGDIMICSGKLRLTWQDQEGRPHELESEASTIYYRAANHTLLIPGSCRINTPQGTLCFQTGAAITLEPAPHQPAKTGFMSQFTGVRLAGVRRAEAWGQVIASAPADPRHSASEIRGDHLIFDAHTGSCLVQGHTCLLTYGSNTLQTDGSIRLEPNGNIYLSGDSISGTYERPAPRPSLPPIQGKFHTADTLVFSAAEHTITAPHGITLQDAYSDFSCTGPLVLTLRRRSHAAASAPSFGNLNLAITRYDDLSHARASGHVVLHHCTTTPGTIDTELTASEADINLLTGEATLTAASGEQASLRSGDYSLAASSPSSPSLVELNAAGDIRVTGEQINASLPTAQGPAHLLASQSLQLTRADGQILVGPHSRISSPQGILTANGTLTLLLHPGEPEQARPILPRFPHLIYNFDGLSQASTPQGGTLRTAQASMQCSGPITVHMNPNPPAQASSPISAILHASAQENVALAGKDSMGRIISASGDKLTINGTTGEKRLTGRQVSLADAYNTHTASGPSAQVVIDQHNNARISGSRQTTTATRIPDQIEQNKKR